MILEPARADEPARAISCTRLRELCHDNGALFILDEMITGFRWHHGGAQQVYGIEPDLSCFGKAMANGFSVSALAGKREFMRLGGLEHTDRPRVFLLSTTHGAETHALAAADRDHARSTETSRSSSISTRSGRSCATGSRRRCRRHGLGRLRQGDRAALLPAYATLDADGSPSQAFRTLFLQETIRRGVLAPSLVVSYTHSEADIARTVEAIDGALGVYARALEDGVEFHLHGRASQVVYTRYNAPGYP